MLLLMMMMMMMMMVVTMMMIITMDLLSIQKAKTDVRSYAQRRGAETAPWGQLTPSLRSLCLRRPLPPDLAASCHDS